MNDDLHNAAAEYVLGTLPADERARLKVEMERNAELSTAVRWWERRLAGLGEAVTAEPVPARLWEAIEQATRQEASATAGGTIAGNVVQLRRRLAVWRGAALAAGALAAGLAGVVVLDRLSVPAAPEGGRYVAVVDAEGREPALIAEVDTRTGTIRVRSVAAEVPAGRSLELWHIPEGQEARSLGVIEAGGPPTLADRLAGPANGMIAVTLEPPGGSPTGVATGPVVYSGRLIPVE